MGIKMVNEKGLNASFGSLSFIRSNSLRDLIAAAQKDSQISESDRAAALALLARVQAELPLESRHHWHDLGQTDKQVHIVPFFPHGWVNETQIADISLESMNAHIDLIKQLHALRAPLTALCKTHKIAHPDFSPEQLAHWRHSAEELEKMAKKTPMDAIPGAAAIKKIETAVIEEAGPAQSARAGHAFAIWMGDRRDTGYMDTKKRPAGAAGARLFESAEAAARTARAASFGDGKAKGPAAIVQLAIEPIALEPGHATPTEIMGALAHIEQAQLQAAIEAVSLDRIRELLGVSPAPVAPDDPLPNLDSNSLAGAQSGWAVWRDYRSDQHPHQTAGFVNQRDGLGPLVGAVLFELLQTAERKLNAWSRSQSDAILRVVARPVEIVALLGSPYVAPLENAIEHERAMAEKAALARANADSLRARAQLLESGAAQPTPARRRSNRL